MRRLLPRAQSDFAALQQSGLQANPSSSSQSADPIVQAFNQLSQDLQSGNVSAAQQDYAALQQDFQQFVHTNELVTTQATSSPSSSSSFSVNA